MRRLSLLLLALAATFPDGDETAGEWRNLEGGTRDGGTYTLCFPGHNFTTHWNGGSQGHDDDLVPLGSGALLLMGFGAAYALAKRNKKE